MHDTMFNPRVSIVIPVYNGSDFLAQAIDSALAQTYGNIEIIVVNDGSNDGGASEGIAQSYGDRIRYYAKANEGVASALNAGIAQMSGDYFSWLSHDDLYVKEKIAMQVAFLSSMAASTRAHAAVYSDYSLFTTDPERSSACVMNGVPPQEFVYWLLTENALHGCTLLLPKTALDEIGIFNETLRTTQDYDLWFRMAKKYQFFHLPGRVVKARIHPGQGSITMSGLAAEECTKLFFAHLDALTFEDIAPTSSARPAVTYAQIASALWYRGFGRAAGRAMGISRSYFASASWQEKLRVYQLALKGISMYLFLNPVRKRVPPVIRRTLRNWLSAAKAPAQAAVPHPDSVLGLELKDKFSEVYEKNIFKGKVSRSGAGSDLVQTETIRAEIPKLLIELGVKTFLDAPCGDWYWMQHVDLPVERYIGVDIVETLIAKNQAVYGNEKISFQAANLAEDALPKADLIFSRDCLVHLSYADALKIVANFKRSGATYLLTTTFTDRASNLDLGSGFWRPLNKQAAPFNFPTPLRLINEGCTEGNHEFTDKCLGLWRLADIMA